MSSLSLRLGKSYSYNYVILLNPYSFLFFKNNMFFMLPSRLNFLFNYRINLFLSQFFRCGKKLKAKLFFLNLLRLVKFRLKCKNPVFLLNFALRVLEPFFEVRSIKRKRKTIKVMVINSFKRRVFLASKFFLAGVQENVKKKKKSTLLVILEELVLLVKKSFSSVLLRNYKNYNREVRKSRFFSDKKFKYVSKFPKKIV